MFYRKLVVGVVAMAACAGLRAQVAPNYVNHNLIEVAPQINATSFFNDGVFDISSTLPFTTINTRYFTNRGTLISSPGFSFSYDADSAAGKKPATKILNQGTIIAEDGFRIVQSTVTDGTTFFGAAAGASWLHLNATNIFSSGLLSAGTEGLVQIYAKNLELKRGGIRTGSPPGNRTSLSAGGFTADRSNYLNAAGITDNYWGTGTNQNLYTPGQPLNLELEQLDTPFPATPVHQVNTVLNVSNLITRLRLPLNGDSQIYDAFVRTNLSGGTNAVIQVVFVATNLNTGEATARVTWSPGIFDGADGIDGASVPIIEVRARAFDNVLAAFVTNSIYIFDEMAAITNLFVGQNIQTVSGRPSNYQVWTGTGAGLGGFIFGGLPSNSRFNYFEHIWNPNWSFSRVTNGYAAYSFNYNLPATTGTDFVFTGFFDGFFGLANPFVVDWQDPTNVPGRVFLAATESMNLENTRLRGERYLNVKSPHVELNDYTSIDSPILNLDLGNTNIDGMLRIKDLVPAVVERVAGPIYLWSASWTNLNVTFDVDPETGNATSNTTIIRNFVTFVDNQDIAGLVPVVTEEIRLKAREVVVSDPMTVQRAVKFEARDLTLDAALDFGPEIGQMGSHNFKGLVNLTNSGEVFQNSGGVDLGPGFVPRFETFENSGTWLSYYWNLKVDQLINSGTLYGYRGPLYVTAGNLNTEFGELLSLNDVHLTCNTLSSAFSTARAGSIDGSLGGVSLLFPGRLYIDVRDHVDDGGFGANNNWNSTDGFEMLRKPTTGDFTGTMLTSFGYQFSEITHKWGAEDRGADQDGYYDNASVGTLVLNGQMLSRFTFETVNGNNAMYVWYLDLRGYAASDTLDGMSIEPGMKIYFANSSVPPEELNGLFDGRLIYLPMPTIPTSQVTLSSGQVVTAKNGLLNSMAVDSDGDGIVNGLDASPFDEVVFRVDVVSEPKARAVISWVGAPRTEYQVEYKDNVDAAGWKVLGNLVTMSDQRNMSMVDAHPSSSHRYYRVIYTP